MSWIGTAATALKYAPAVMKGAQYIGSKIGSAVADPLTRFKANRDAKKDESKAQKIINELLKDPNATDEIKERCEELKAVAMAAREYVGNQEGDDFSKGKAWRVSDAEVKEAERALAVAIKRSNVSRETINKLPTDFITQINRADPSEEVKTHYTMYPFVIVGECVPASDDE